MNKKFFRALALFTVAGWVSTAGAGLIADRASFDAAVAEAIVDDYTDAGYSSIPTDAAMSAVRSRPCWSWLEPP